MSLSVRPGSWAAIIDHLNVYTQQNFDTLNPRYIKKKKFFHNIIFKEEEMKERNLEKSLDARDLDLW